MVHRLGTVAGADIEQCAYCRICHSISVYLLDTEVWVGHSPQCVDVVGILFRAGCRRLFRHTGGWTLPLRCCWLSCAPLSCGCSCLVTRWIHWFRPSVQWGFFLSWNIWLWVCWYITACCLPSNSSLLPILVRCCWELRQVPCLLWPALWLLRE